MTAKVKIVLGQLRRRFEGLYGGRLVRLVLYGSQARGDADAESDIDVLVVLRGPVAPCEEIARTIDDVAAVSLAQNVVVCCVFVSDEEFQREQSPLLINVHREGVLV